MNEDSYIIVGLLTAVIVAVTTVVITSLVFQGKAKRVIQCGKDTGNYESCINLAFDLAPKEN